MNLQEMQDELAKMEADLRAHNMNVVAPAKQAVEESAGNIEKARQFYTNSNAMHGQRVTELEDAHQVANNKQRDIHVLISKIQTLHGQAAIRRVVTAGVDLGMDAAMTAEAKGELNG